MAARFGGRRLLEAAALLMPFAAVFLWAYGTTLGQLVETWNRQPDCSHGYLVVPLAILFCWLRRDRLPKGTVRPAWGGLGLLAEARCCWPALRSPW